MIQVAILVVSTKMCRDRSSDNGRSDLEQYLSHHEVQIVAYEIVPDDRTEIRERLLLLWTTVAPPVILTIGGTGVRPTDWAPEATKDLIEKEIPGIAEAMRAESLQKVKTAMLSRGIAGIRGSTLIVNLPGSPKGSKENLALLLPILDHIVEKVSNLSTTSS